MQGEEREMRHRGPRLHPPHGTTIARLHPPRMPDETGTGARVRVCVCVFLMNTAQYHGAALRAAFLSRGLKRCVETLLLYQHRTR